MNYERNKKYFKSTSFKNPIIAIVVGLLLLAALPGSGKVLGFIVAAVGGVLIYFQTAGRPSDNEIDDICAKEIENAKEKGLKKLGLDEDEVKLIAPITIRGHYHRNISTQVQYKYGKDNHWRTSNYETIVLFFSEKQVYAYKYRFSLIANERNESTDEYFYKDIVSVATSSDTITIKDTSGKDTSINFEEFKLTTSGGTSITCSVWDLGSVEKVIQGMKQLLREKKNA